jgi:hypothetical protein
MGGGHTWERRGRKGIPSWVWCCLVGERGGGDQGTYRLVDRRATAPPPGRRKEEEESLEGTERRQPRQASTRSAGDTTRLSWWIGVPTCQRAGGMAKHL